MNAEASDLWRGAAEIIPWFHSIDLGGGVVTPGQAVLDECQARADIYFGVGIEGYSVLDVGAWDGFYSFEAERRGASRVLAVDKFCWGYGGRGNPEAFRYARRALNSRVEDALLDLDETTEAKVGRFDLVLFNGIVYHDPHALEHLRQVARITTQALTVETFVDMMDVPRPMLVFYPGEDAPKGFPQNGCGVNSLFMGAYLKRLGFETVLEFPTPALEAHRQIYIALKPGHSFGRFAQDHADMAI